MIKLEHTDVMNFENAIRGMRNPMNSWDKSDSVFTMDPYYFTVGPNDLDLAQRLCNAGSDHRKFLRQIFVSVDITAPLYFWKEYDTYKVGTTANSTSTMHRIHAKEFEIGDFSCERMLPSTKQLLWLSIIPELNDLRDNFNKTKDKDVWYAMIQLLPSSYNQMRTCTMTYENLRNMYHARKNHKLEEWRTFCKWVETLPYAAEFLID